MPLICMFFFTFWTGRKPVLPKLSLWTCVPYCSLRYHIVGSHRIPTRMLCRIGRWLVILRWTQPSLFALKIPIATTEYIYLDKKTTDILGKPQDKRKTTSKQNPLNKTSNAKPWHTTCKSKMYAQGSAWKDMVQQSELPRHSFAQTMNYSSEVVGCIFVLHMYCQKQTNKWFRTFFGITTQVLAQTRVAHFPWPFTIVFIRIGIRDSFSDYLCAVIVLNL